MCSCEDVDEALNNLSLEIAKECPKGMYCNVYFEIVGNIVSVEIVEKVVNKSITNEFDYKDEIVGIYDAFDTSLLHFEKTSRHYHLYVCYCLIYVFSMCVYTHEVLFHTIGCLICSEKCPSSYLYEESCGVSNNLEKYMSSF